MQNASNPPRTVAFSVVLTLLGLAALELGARIFVDAPVRPPADSDLRYTVDSDRLWTHLPGQYVVRPGAGGGPVVEYRINAEGLRSPEIPGRKAEGEVRILTIGDSVTLGYGVTEGQDYPCRLQVFLEARRPDLDLRVLNAGVSAYSTKEELDFLRKRGVGLEPDVVVVGFVINDISMHNRRMYRERFGRLRSRQILEEGAAPVAELLGRSRLVVLLAGLCKFVRSRVGGGEVDVLRREFTRERMIRLETSPVREAWARMEEEMDAIVALLADRGIPLLIVIFPERHQVRETPTPDRPQRAMEAFCAERGVPFLDLLPRFLEGPPEPLYLDDIHLTGEGYDLSARAIGEALLGEGLLPPERPHR